MNTLKTLTFTTSAPQEIINHLRLLTNVKICIRNNTTSICAASMLIEILKKEAIEYEVMIGKISKEYCVCIDMETENGLIFGIKNQERKIDEDSEKENYTDDLINQEKDIENEKYKINVMKDNDIENNKIEYKFNENSEYNNNALNIENDEKENYEFQNNSVKDSIDEIIEYKNNLINIKSSDNEKKRQDKNTFLNVDKKIKKNKTYVISTNKNKFNSSPLIIYEIAKKLSYITNKILWPLAVLFSQNDLESENSDSSDEIENENIEIDVNIQIKKYNENKGEIVKEKSFYRPFLGISNLYLILTKDLLMYKKFKYINVYKIKEKLAKFGISLKEAAQPYNSISNRTKKQIEKNMGKTIFYTKKINYENKITAEENFYLINYFLYKNKPLLALLCLDKDKYIKNILGKRFYDKVASIINESFCKIKKIGKLSMLFVDKKYFGINKTEIILKCVFDKCKGFIDVEQLIVICEGKEESIVVCEEYLEFGDEIYENCYRIEKRLFKNVIDLLLDKKS